MLYCVGLAELLQAPCRLRSGAKRACDVPGAQRLRCRTFKPVLTHSIARTDRTGRQLLQPEGRAPSWPRSRSWTIWSVRIMARESPVSTTMCGCAPGL
jgi:hypothetical protein